MIDKEIKSKETPREMFKRVSGKRLDKALYAIGMIGNLSKGKGSYYEYDETDVENFKKIISKAVREAIESMRTGRRVKILNMREGLA